MGGISPEREVSLMSSRQIIENLDPEKYEIIPIEINSPGFKEWVKRLIEASPDIVLSGLHGGIGENGAVQGLLECLEIPYAGSGVMGSAISMDKAMSKLILRAAHIPVADGVFVRRFENLSEYEERVLRLGFPLVVKPNKGGSSVGVSIVKNMEELRQAADGIRLSDDDILIEKYLDGQEVTCGVLETEHGLEVLAVLDIGAANDFYDYDAKYFNEMTSVAFSRLPHFLRMMIEQIAKKVFTVLECGGYGRVDMIVKEEQVYVLEMNTLPGLTAHSLIPKAAQGIGMDFGAFLDHLIDYALKNGHADLRTG
jgi:D-alanine-D-alanine ligase